MNRSAARKPGFALVIVIALIALSTTAIALLAAGSSQLAQATRRAYVQACVRNLRASGQAWACQQVRAAQSFHTIRSGESPSAPDARGKTTGLDVSALAGAGGALTVIITRGAGCGPVTVQARYGKARCTWKGVL